MKNQFILISDTQAIIKINDLKVTSQQAIKMSETATKHFKEGKTIVLSPDFEILDWRLGYSMPDDIDAEIARKDIYPSLIGEYEIREGHKK